MLTKEKKLALIKEFGASETDSGSTAVQVALLTHEITVLQEHLEKHKKDFSTHRGLMQKVQDRKTHLLYLKRTSTPDRYNDVIARLGIRK